MCSAICIINASISCECELILKRREREHELLVCEGPFDTERGSKYLRGELAERNRRY